MDDLGRSEMLPKRELSGVCRCAPADAGTFPFQARRMGWTGVVLYAGTLATLMLSVALLLIRIPPLPGNLLRPEDGPDAPPG